jgi:subtilisin family serine protease
VENVREFLLLPENAPNGRGVSVAVLDTGVDLEHPDLSEVIDEQRSQVTALMSRKLADVCGHGTHVAGIIAGQGVIDSRYRGIAPGAKLVIYKISSGGSGLEGDVLAAIDAAIDAGVDIINYSQSFSPKIRGIWPPPWVWPMKLSAVEAAFVSAAQRGILCVVAAGNDGDALSSINRPAGLDEVLAVGALDRAGKVSKGSSRGPFLRMEGLPIGGERRLDVFSDHNVMRRRKPDIVAPGVDVVATRAAEGTLCVWHQLIDPTDPHCPYIRWSGTSMATAVVSGLAACLLQQARDEAVDLGIDPAATLRALFRHAARPIADQDVTDFGHGDIRWPMLIATLSDFATDDSFRRIILEGPRLTLLE